jgi:hypothetical protein
MNPRRTCALAALAGLLTAGCAAAGGGAAAGGQAPVTGHLAGRLVMEGGPLGPSGVQPSERPISGTVTFTDVRHRQVTVRVTSSGRFSVGLPPGRYQVSGRSPSIEASGETSGNKQEPPCSPPLSAIVAAGRTAAVTITCIVP